MQLRQWRKSKWTKNREKVNKLNKQSKEDNKQSKEAIWWNLCDQTVKKSNFILNDNFVSLLSINTNNLSFCCLSTISISKLLLTQLAHFPTVER